MLPADAFLRRLPIGVAPEQLLTLEGLVYCGDAVNASYGVMRALALTHGAAISEPENRIARIHMFINAWTIVDSVHVAIDLINALGFEVKSAASFIEKYEVATLLRNKMDHVSKQLKNLAAKKGAPPLLGAISYVHVPAEDWTTESGITGGRMISISVGHIRDASTVALLPNPVDVGTFGLYDHEVPQFGQTVVGGFQLMAFAESLLLKIDDVVDDLTALLTELNAAAGQQIPAQLEKYAKENGFALEDVMAPVPAGFSAYVVFETGEPPQEIS